jgi:hypothetical protein
MFSLTDLNLEIDGEPRIRDLTIADRLGYERPRKIRELIEANMAELQQYGLAPRRGAPITSGKGRVTEVEEYWLNEAQCLLVCMFSRTDAAAEVRRALIEVFMAWRRGELPPPKAAMPEALLDPEDERLWQGRLALARRILGKEAARLLWSMSPLPQVEADNSATASVRDEAERSARACLAHLLDWRKSPDGLSIGEMVRNTDDWTAAAPMLRPLGLIPNANGWEGWLAVATSHPTLRRVFAGTIWRDGWRDALLRLPGARISGKVFKFDGLVSRAVMIPAALVQRDENHSREHAKND